MTKKIISFKHPMLRSTSPHVEPTSSYCKEVVQALKETFEELGPLAAGLSAVQIGELARVFVMREQLTTEGEPKVLLLINPKIKSIFVGATTNSYEGCISIPGVLMYVQRPASVTMTYCDEEGVEQERVFNAQGASVALHEFDHLTGIWFVDRASNYKYRRDFWKKNKVKLKAVSDPYEY